MQGEYVEAEPLFRQAFRKRESVFGSHHPDTAKNMLGLARGQDNYEAAKALYVRALVTYEQALGACHPKTMEIRKHFINLLYAVGEDEEAAQLQSYQSEQRTHGEERKAHPEE